MDWQAVEAHLQTHPEEASILCPTGRKCSDFIFPLEAALTFKASPVPLSTVQLLISLCPEAATISDSSALLMACARRNQEDPRVIRLVLNANPAMAAETDPYLIDWYEEPGLPLHQIVQTKSSACATQIASDLIAANSSSLFNTSTIYHQIPLQLAVQRRPASPDLLRILLENGYRYNDIQKIPKGPLFYAGDPHHVIDENDTPMNEIISRTGLIRDLEGKSQDELEDMHGPR